MLSKIKSLSQFFTTSRSFTQAVQKGILLDILVVGECKNE